MATTKKPAAPTLSAHQRSLDAFKQKMAKTYGDGVFTFSPTVVEYDVIPTGSLELDLKLGVGGFPVGRLHEIWGAEGTGKSTMCLILVAEAQAKFPDRVVAWIDVEHRFDKPWAVAHGVDLDRLILIVPSNAEDVADQVKDLCRSGLVSLIVVDSIGAMIPQKEIEKDAEDAVVGKQAQIVTRMVKIAAVEADQTKTTVMMINQVRANISGYGNPMTTGGGFALRHSTTTKLQIKRRSGASFLAKMGGEDRVVGHGLAITVERNSVAPAYRTADINLFHVATDKYGPIGIDRADEATNIGMDTGVIIQNGGWYTLSITGEKVNGRPAMVDLLRQNPDLIPQIRARALATVASEVTEEDTGPMRNVEDDE